MSVMGSFIETELNAYEETYKELETKDKEIERLNKKIEQYENPEDMTLMFMWCDEKAKDEIKRLNNILNELEEETRCGYYEYSSSDGDYIEGYDDGASKTADFFNKMIKELRGDSK